MLLSDAIAERLVQCGIRHVFGVGGANIEDIFAAVQRRRPLVRAVLNKHEHAAGSAADAYARLSGGLGVVMVTSGGGAMNLVHSIAEARASSVPILAIVGEPPSELQGKGAFQDTSGQNGSVDAAAVFRTLAVWCARVERPSDIFRLLSEAMATAVGERPGPAVLLIAKDLQQSDVASGSPPVASLTQETRPDPALIRRASELLRAGPTVIIAGDQVGRSFAQRELATLAEIIDADVVVTPDARDAFDNYTPGFIGVGGAMGTPDVARAIARARACVIVGTRLPLLARQGLEAVLAEKPLVSIGRERLYIDSPLDLHLDGDLRSSLSALRDALGSDRKSQRRRRAPTPASARRDESHGFDSRTALAAIERSLSRGGVVLVDAGNTGATTAHALRSPRDGRWLLAMGMAGMGYTFGAAIGAACATGQRCTVLAGDGAFFMNGFDVHTAVEHQLPITYVIFDNRAHGMCLVRERLLLGENAGYNTFRRSHIGAGLAAMFPGLPACDCRSVEALERAVADAAATSGPSVVSVELEDVEIPPFLAFQTAAGRGQKVVTRGAHDGAR